MLVLAAGLLYSGLLYVKNKKNKLSRYWAIILFVFRFLTVSTIAFLLLNPFYKVKTRKVEKPIVIVGIDNSRSIISGVDSNAVQATFPTQIKQLTEELSTNYQVDSYLFGSKVTQGDSVDFTDETSDYAEFFQQIIEDYKGQNVGSLLIAGDGISNRGIDPVFAASAINYPIYAIALGDTNQNRDFKINELFYNSLAYKDDVLPFKLNIQADRLTGNTATILVNGFGKEQFRKEILVEKDMYNQEFDFSIKAESAGKQRISIQLISDALEISKENNREDIFIDILDTRKKILVLANAPHPDLGSIKSSLEKTGNYTVDIQYPEKRSGSIGTYDMLILHQLPSMRVAAIEVLSEAREKKIPLLFILGKQSNILQFNREFKGLNILTATGNFESAQADINPLFTFFTFDKSAAEQLENLPPLFVPLGKYILSQGCEVFAYQKLRNISTDFPLVAFFTDLDLKQGIITGEGLWLWRMNNFLQNNNYDAFDNFLNKTVQYLVARKDKRFFRIDQEGAFRNNENVVLRAELFDQSYNKVNNVEVELKLYNEKGEQNSYIFSAEGESYMLDLKVMPEGIYNYVATTRLGNEKYSSAGEFIVKKSTLETRMLIANHGLLYRLATQHNGQLFHPNEMNSLSEKIMQKELKSKIYYEEKFSSLREISMVLLLILALLTIEWFLRKYLGSY